MRNPCFASGKTGCAKWLFLYDTPVQRHVNGSPGYGIPRGGLVEAGGLLDDLDVEIIYDNCHQPPELIRLAVKCKGYDKLMLVSDCI